MRWPQWGNMLTKAHKDPTEVSTILAALEPATIYSAVGMIDSRSRSICHIVYFYSIMAQYTRRARTKIHLQRQFCGL